MWEAISAMLNGNNAVNILLTIVVLVIMIIIAAKLGIFKFKGTKLRIGKDQRDNERDIIRQQVDVAKQFVLGRMSYIDNSKLKYDGFLAKYILEVCFDEIISWIMFNHISEDSAYVELKQNKILSILDTFPTMQPEFQTPKFKNQVKQWVSDLIHLLCETRKVCYR